ncbi:MAG: amidohydrolase family protein, partial [Candidatus Binatia bacterium]
MAKSVAQNIHVVDADGHGGEFSNWRDRLPEKFKPRLAEYQERIKRHFANLPGMGTSRKGDKFAERAGMRDPAERLKDMDLEGIDVTVMFPGGAGEEWAMLDRDFAIALCRTLNDARAEFCRYEPKRLKSIAKLPMIDPDAAAAELRRCVTEHGFVGMVTPQHVRERNLDDRAFDVVWAEAERLGVAVCVHGGGQAVDQEPIGVQRFQTRLEVHALTHPLGQMIAVDCFTVGGILHRFPKLRVGFMESGAGWLPYWLERLDEHWELMPEQAPGIDRKPSEYFLDGGAYISCESDERMLPAVIETLGDRKIVYASDYYHWDCSFPDTVRQIVERSDIGDGSKMRILG